MTRYGISNCQQCSEVLIIQLDIQFKFINNRTSYQILFVRWSAVQNNFKEICLKIT